MLGVKGSKQKIIKVVALITLAEQSKEEAIQCSLQRQCKVLIPSHSDWSSKTDLPFQKLMAGATINPFTSSGLF